MDDKDMGSCIVMVVRVLGELIEEMDELGGG